MMRRKRQGFTLIEIITAVAILSIVATMVFGGFSQTGRNKKRMESELEYYRVIQLSMERMARELSMAFISVHQNISPSLQVVRTGFIGEDHGRFDRIDFTSFSHRRLRRNSHQSDQNELSYFVTTHPEDNSKRVLARREQHRIDDDPQKGGTVQILIEDIDGFEVDYLEPLTGEWVSRWDSTQAASGQPNRLPSQVRIKLTLPDFRDPQKSRVFATRAILPMRYALNFAVN